MVSMILSIGLALILTLVAPASAARYSMVAVIETQTQGPLDCGNRTRGLEGTDVLYGLTDEATAPTADTIDRGVNAQARPIVVRKPLDRCSPALFLALVGREQIARVEIRLFDNQGHFFTIRLENVRVLRIAREVREHGFHEDVVLAYQVFQLTDERTGVSASHDFGW